MFVFVMSVYDMSDHTHTTVIGVQKALNEVEWRNRERKSDPLIMERSCSF